ncbi:MAG: Gfo/Idh/MocA family protein [Limnochordia bacterium]|jgi:predicted dehydrogenase
MSQVRLGIVGCGGMSKAHARGFADLADRVSVVATVDVIEERARQAAELFPGAKAATDYRSVLDDVDAVLLVLPHHLHHPIAKACLEAGKHVLLEKPMANSEEECLDLIETSKKADRVLMIAYCMRFHPLVVRLKQLVDERAYGDMFQLSIWTEQLTKYPPDHWASSAATLGGGQLFSHGCHYIDLLLWFLGKPLRGTHLGTNFGTPWMEREGTSNVSMEFEGGRLGYHFGTWGARGSRLRYSFHAHCTDGMLEAATTQGKLYLHQRGQEKVLMEAEAGKHTQNEMTHFLECIETGRRPLTDGLGSLQGLRVIWRLYEAEEQHTVADLHGLGLDEI